jgi:shikimate kinase/shikimate kinase/3-dehydroquinate synthase
MKSKGNIVFLGMMGSGKTSIGKLVSKKFKLEFFDIDKHIEKSLKMEISEIFANKGEKFFRNYEEKITLKILKKKDIIIALGGGAFLNKNLRDEILSNHMSFWLNWNDDTLASRIINSSKRPLTFKTSKQDLIKLSKKRSTVYSKALYKINCDNLTKSKIVDKIINIYESNKTNS